MARDALSIAVLGNGLVDAPNRPTVSMEGAVGNQAIPTSIAQNLLPFPLGCKSPYCLPTHFYTIGINSQLLLPLIDWGTLRSAHNGARATIDSQTAAFQSAERQAVIDVDQALRRFNVDEQNLTLATQNADVAKQAAQIAQLQYKVGLGSQLDVTSAEQTYLQAAKQLLAAQVGFVLAADRLKLATGTLVD
jgi:outer membrane protein TolC